jgi:hypothetical protein
MALLASPMPVCCRASFLPARILGRMGRKGQNFPDLIGIVHRLGRASPERLRPACELPNPLECRHGQPSFRHFCEAIMNEDVFNVSVRRFLKKVGITSQREIEQAIRKFVADGRLKGSEPLPARMTLTVEGVGLAIEIDGDIELE